MTAQKQNCPGICAHIPHIQDWGTRKWDLETPWNEGRSPGPGSSSFLVRWTTMESYGQTGSSPQQIVKGSP